MFHVSIDVKYSLDSTQKVKNQMTFHWHLMLLLIKYSCNKEIYAYHYRGKEYIFYYKKFDFNYNDRYLCEIPLTYKFYRFLPRQIIGLIQNFL